MTDERQVIPVSRRLMAMGAFRGSAQVLFNAALQRQAADDRHLSQWTPSGPVPLSRRQPAEHLHAVNDHLPASNLTA